MASLPRALTTNKTGKRPPPSAGGTARRINQDIADPLINSEVLLETETSRTKGPGVAFEEVWQKLNQTRASGAAEKSADQRAVNHRV